MTSSTPRHLANAAAVVASVLKAGYAHGHGEVGSVEELVEAVDVADGRPAAAELLRTAVAAPAPWLPEEAGHDGEPTWAGPRVRCPEERGRSCDKAALGMLGEGRVEMSRAASEGHGRTCGRRKMAA
jgi:hypothetical protein